MSSLYCSLCQKPALKLVRSHIVPKSFYEEFGKSKLVGLNESGRPNKYLIGIYGKFLCEPCEVKFSLIDAKAAEILKQQRETERIYESSNAGLKFVENAHNYKEVLHQFALSVLWRASASGREEYKTIKLGSYADQIRLLFSSQVFSSDLLSRTGMFFREYRLGPAALNQTFIPYRRFASNSLFKQTFGNFCCHVFGFPYGELFVRLGGETPRQGFLDWGTTNSPEKGVLWTDNLSFDYPNWVFELTANTSIIEKISQINQKHKYN